MKKTILAAAMLLPILAQAAPHDLVISQRNADDSGLSPSRRMTPPADGSSALLAYTGGATQLPTMWTLGTGLTLTGSVLSATAAAVTWSSVTGKPTTFAPAPHVHDVADITTGVLALTRVAGLQAALDAKFNTPTGTAGQVLLGTGAPGAVPTHTQPYSTITATPTTLAGYGITDGATSASLAGKFNMPTGTTAQYVRGDGTLATLPAARRIETYAGTTDATGSVTVTYATAYPVVPNVQPGPPTAANQVWTVVANTTTGFTLRLQQRASVALLGVEVLLAATTPVSGAPAQVLVVAQ